MSNKSGNKVKNALLVKIFWTTTQQMECHGSVKAFKVCNTQIKTAQKISEHAAFQIKLPSPISLFLEPIYMIIYSQLKIIIS